ncbi:MAG: TIGR00341 family protein [Pleurocapsa sp. MO_226.B13]|nr:TIGR00341 family protein [Pleurocapsa sp. MO_226.B13]
MASPKKDSFLQREHNSLNNLRASGREPNISEEDLASGLFQGVFNQNFSILLALATAIATFGLLSNSTATIIGAMIVAPLMIPIISLTYALLILNPRLIGYSLAKIILGIVLTVSIAFFTTKIVGFKVPGSEILSRTEPTLLDLGVAIAAGVAGAYSKIRRSVADAIPGVAISVALVPPLCVTGIGLATNNYQLSSGSFVLFLTNLVGIITSAELVFLFQSYGSWKKGIWGLLILALSIIPISVPLGFSFQKMIADNQINHALLKYNRLYDNRVQSKITAVEVDIKKPGELSVLVDVIREPDGILESNEEDVKQGLEVVRQFLSQEVGKPVHLRVRVFPVEILDYEVSPPTSKNN